jgi:hypothetical protein
MSHALGSCDAFNFANRNQAFRIFDFSRRRVRDNCLVAWEFAVKLDCSNGIPRRRMREEERTAYDSKAVPDKIPSDEYGEAHGAEHLSGKMILTQAKVRQQDDWPNGTERGRRRDSR